MKIIHQGVDPNTKPFQMTCNNCKTIVELVKTELQATYSDNREPGYKYVQCPTCQTHIVYNEVKTQSHQFDR